MQTELSQSEDGQESHFEGAEDKAAAGDEHPVTLLMQNSNALTSMPATLS